MGERALPLKPDEQYPLLKVDGGGDITHVTPAKTLVTPGWSVTCTKNSRFSRWPEFISACWMTLILCGISYLVFHTLGMGLYRRQPVIIMKCNNSKPASNVYYHHIVPRGGQIPFILYTEYLANMAVQYPLLHYNVFFLIDDFYPDALRGSKRSIPAYQSWLHNYKIDEIGKEALNEFLKRYQNVNVTVIPLSKYMAMTPLKFKWRLVPQAHLTFYARVFSVWQNGGIGMDLRAFNNDYHNHLTTYPHIDAILRQHNDGINVEDYTKALKKIDNDEASAIMNMFAGLINNLLSESRSFFNRTLLFPPMSAEKTPLIRTHRSKREVNINPENVVVSVPSNDSKNFYNVDTGLNVPTNFTKNKNESDEVIENTTAHLNITITNATEVKNSKVNSLSNRNNSETHQVVLFYDFSILNGHNSPSLPFISHKPGAASTKASQYLISIDAEGMFIAASSKYHPFLARLVSAGCFAMPPKFAIRDVLMSQCSGINQEDAYCNNIYIL